jgi:Flp pilus assembly pilin Flp
MKRRMPCNQGESQHHAPGTQKALFPSCHPPLCIRIHYSVLHFIAATQRCCEVVYVRRLREAWLDEEGQDIAEYAVMLAVILVIVVATVRLIGGNANNVFSTVASSIGQ